MVAAINTGRRIRFAAPTGARHNFAKFEFGFVGDYIHPSQVLAAARRAASAKAPRAAIVCA